jgi:predicted dehydrogenase
MPNPHLGADSKAGRNPLKALIVGCGRIGALADTPNSDVILTHAHALQRLPTLFKVIGFIDPAKKALATAVKLWGGVGHESFESYFATGEKPDVIVICSPDEFHLAHLKKGLEWSPKAIVVEKPLSFQVNDLKDLNSSSGPQLPPIAVNYTRRYMPIYQNFLQRLASQEFGSFLHGSGTYSKGLFHSGSHLVNLILPLLNRPLSSVIPLGERNDYRPEDKTIDCLMKFSDNSYFLLRSVDSRLYELFEIELYFEHCRIRIDRKGRRLSYDLPKVQTETTGIKYIEEDEVYEEKNIDHAFLKLYEGIYDTVFGESKLVCDVQDSIDTLTVCEHLRKHL